MLEVHRVEPWTGASSQAPTSTPSSATASSRRTSPRSWARLLVAGSAVTVALSLLWLGYACVGAEQARHKDVEAQAREIEEKQLKIDALIEAQAREIKEKQFKIDAVNIPRQSRGL